MLDFTSYLTYMNTNHVQINLGLDIFMIILLIVLIFGGGVSGIGAGFTVAGLVIVQIAQLTLNLALQNQDKLMSRFATAPPSLDESQF